jgi:MurNAc alpha-1-phosphate uridylyltransferase
MNADILTNMNMNALIELHKKENPIATLAVSERESSRYFLFNKQHELCGWKNVKTNEEKIIRQETDLNSLAFSGIQILNNNIFNFLLPAEKFSLVDVYLQACKTEKIIGFNHTGSLVFDVGKPESIHLAEENFD